ncbi:MAG: hypothetical protein ACK5PZ_05590 [Pirellula sp.]|jgi:hypothetical protein
MRNHFWIVSAIVSAACFLSNAAPSHADEREELKAKIAQLREESEELAKNGKPEQARQRKREAAELMAALERQSERQSERQNRPESPERARQGRPNAEQVEKLERTAKRLQHLRAAAENLKMAEMHDMAHEVTRKAEDIEKDLGNAKEAFARSMQNQRQPGFNPPGLNAPGAPMARFMEENEQLKREMRELREMVERMAGEMKRIAGEMKRARD